MNTEDTEIIELFECATCGHEGDARLDAVCCEDCGALICDGCARRCEAEHLCAACTKDAEEWSEYYRELDRWVTENK